MVTKKPLTVTVVATHHRWDGLVGSSNPPVRGPVCGRAVASRRVMCAAFPLGSLDGAVHSAAPLLQTGVCRYVSRWRHIQEAADSVTSAITASGHRSGVSFRWDRRGFSGHRKCHTSWSDIGYTAFRRAPEERNACRILARFSSSSILKRAIYTYSHSANAKLSSNLSPLITAATKL
jgi:hypothetical protein